MTETNRSDVRPAQFADDQWYPSSAADLRRRLAAFLAEAPDAGLGRPLGLVAPHAGLTFSGGVAAYAYRQLQGHHYDPVVVLSPLHRRPLGRFAVTGYQAYATPLGRIPLAEDVIASLDRELTLTRPRQDDEHSLEIQLPFLQYVLGDFELVPVMMGDQSPAACAELASALVRSLKGRRPLIVASSDLSHFHDYNTAVALDRLILDRIEAFDPEGLAQDLGLGSVEACGGGPIVAMLMACREMGATETKVLKYANSGDVWVDRSSVVGYVAAVVSSPPENPMPHVVMPEVYDHNP